MKGFDSIRGMRDLFGEEMEKFALMEERARRVFALYGYEEVRTPVLEFSDLFLSGIGEGTDIVTKEMYSFPDAKGRSMTMRPEGTAPVLRHVAMNRLLREQPNPRCFYVGPMFRFERPQKGRYRQFHQLGAELFGEEGVDAETELLLMSRRFLETIGLKDAHFAVNWIGDAAERSAFKTRLKTALASRREELCGLCRKRFETNPLRMFDCKNPACQTLLDEAPRIRDSISDRGRREFDRLVDFLERNAFSHVVRPKLVRGLDYYSDFVFEVYSGGFDDGKAVGGGGRYDGLFEVFGEPRTGGVGFAFGMDRLALLMEPPTGEPAKCMVIGADKAKNAELAETLRTRGIRVLTAFGDPARFKSQIKKADRQLCSHVLILGEDEIAGGAVSVKNLQTGEQRTVPVERLGELEDIFT